MGGIAGQYFRQFGLTVAIAVIFSLMVARFITPVIAAYFMRTPRHHEVRDGAIMKGYTSLVRASVRHRWITLIIGVVIFAASIWSTRLLPSGFIPADDLGRVLLGVELPPGSKLDDTDRVTRKISEQLRAMPEVRSALIFGGTLLGGSSEPRRATFVLNFVHKSKREATQKELQTRIDAMLANTPDIRYWFVKDNGQRDLSLIIAGPDIDQINDTAEPDRQRDALDPDPRESDLDGRARPSGAARDAEAPGRRRPRRFDRGAVLDRSASQRSATSTPISPSSTPAIASCRSASNSTRRARSRVGVLQDLRVADRVGLDGAALRRRGFHGEPWADRDQPLRPLAPRDDRSRSAGRRGARRSVAESAHCRPPAICRQASKSARPATSRS